MENVSSSNGHKEYPHLRFHAEDGTNYPDLESYSMGDLYTERKEAGEEGLPILSVSIHTGVSDGELDESETTKRVKRIDDKSLYRKADTGDLVFNMMRAWQGALGVVKTAGMVSPAYIVAKPNDKVYPPYVDYYVKTDNMVNQIHRLSYGVTDFRLRLYWTSFQAVKCRLPVKQEQKRIADFLKKLDERIEKQRELVENLKKYKRGLLNSLITRKLAFIPCQIWHTTKLGDIFRERTERSTGDEVLLAVTIRSGVQKRDVMNLRDNSSDDKSHYKRVYTGDLVYNTMRMWQGASGASSFDGIVSPAYTVITPIDATGTNIIFWSYYFKFTPLVRTFQKYSQGLTSDTWNLKFPQFSEIKVLVPPLEEQTAIAGVLSSIDKRIQGEEKKLTFFGQFRSSLMQQLFI